tara:strand:- start:2309 stop:2533 length:225 start_codon:yes stop_codon:yes gene_type:complete
MTVLEDAENYISGTAPKAICDDCLALKLRITPRQHANQKSRELAGRAQFDRRKGDCSVCGHTKLVIRRKQAKNG